MSSVIRYYDFLLLITFHVKHYLGWCRRFLIRNYYPLQRSTNALPNLVNMAVAALTRLTATAALVLKDSWEIIAKPVGHITLFVHISTITTPSCSANEFVILKDLMQRRFRLQNIF